MRWLILLYAKQPRNSPNSICASFTFSSKPHTSLELLQHELRRELFSADRRT